MSLAIKCLRPRLLTFDAFGTIYTPKHSIAKVYCDFVEPFGIAVTPEEIGVNFKNGQSSLSVVCVASFV
jgi:hypothetical protein